MANRNKPDCKHPSKTKHSNTYGNKVLTEERCNSCNMLTDGPWSTDAN